MVAKPSKDESEITPEMVEAGAEVLWKWVDELNGITRLDLSSRVLAAALSKKSVSPCKGA